MSLSFLAEYPGATPQEAYQDALAGLETVPFTIGWYDIKMTRLLGGDEATFADGWTWVATLKAGD